MLCSTYGAVLDQGAAAASSRGGDPEEDDAVPARLVTALLLAWAAGRARSLLAARCLVAAALELFGNGATADDVQLALSLAGFQSGSVRLAEDERDVLTSWVALVFMTAEEVGCPAGRRPRPAAEAASTSQGGSRTSGGDGSSGSSGRASSARAGVFGASSGGISGSAGGDGSATSLGMRRFVKQAVAQFAGGTRLADLMELQAAGGSGASVPPSVRLMQQNTRLIILTLEVLAESGARLRLPDAPATAQRSQQLQPQQPDSLPEQQPQQQPQEQPRQQQQQQQEPSSSEAGTGDSNQAAADRSHSLDTVGYVAAFPIGGGAPSEPRPAAVLLLVEYMGAMLRSRASAAAFVDSAAACYRHGFTAGELYKQLAAEEFEQQGGMLAVALPSQPGAASVTAEIFGRWLSVVYMTLAQLGVARPAPDAADGWAWAGGGGTVQAHAIAEFVTNTLRAAPPGLPAAGGASDSPALDAIRSAQQQQQQRAPAEDFSMVRLEDPSLAATSSSVVALGQQIDLINFTAALADAEGWTPAGAGRRRLAWRPPSEQQEADTAAADQREGRIAQQQAERSPAQQSSGGLGKQAASSQPLSDAAAGLRRKELRRQQQQHRAGRSDQQRGQQRERQQVPCPWPRRVNRRIS